MFKNDASIRFEIFKKKIMTEHVILVDQNDTPIGEMEKIEAHEKALLHRAFSVFVFNDQNELLLQKRASTKYHSGGLWTNTCCSHQRQGESSMDAAHRRLKEEMGFDCPLTHEFHFIYKVDFDNGLTEHEFDHVFFGRYNENIIAFNPDEVEDFKYVSINKIQQQISEDASQFTFWFLIAFKELIKQRPELLT